MKTISSTLALIAMITSSFSHAQAPASENVAINLNLYSFAEPTNAGSITLYSVTPKADSAKADAPFKYKITSYDEAKVASVQIFDRDEKCGILGSATIAIQDQKQMTAAATQLAPGLIAEVERNVSKCEKLGMNIVPSKSARSNFIAKALNSLIPSAQAMSTCNIVASVITGLGIVIAVGGVALGNSKKMGVISGVGASIGALALGFIVAIIGGANFIGCAIFDKSGK